MNGCGASTALSVEPPDADAETITDADLVSEVDAETDSETDAAVDARPDADEDADECLQEEVCDDLVDNDCDGVIDEGCDDCPPGVEVPTDELCGDALDNDCDGIIDEDCPSPAPCLCVPGGVRYCDDPSYPRVGTQVCNAGGTGWGPCVAVDSLPEICAAVDELYSAAFETCLVENEHCAQDQWDLDGDGDTWESLGECTGITCPPEGCVCRPGGMRWCEQMMHLYSGQQVCEEGLRWGPCLSVDESEVPDVCRTWAYTEAFQRCLVDLGRCVQDVWDLDVDGNTIESMGECAGAVCAVEDCCEPGRWRWCDRPEPHLWGWQFCLEDGRSWGGCGAAEERPPTACRDEWEFTPVFEDCLIEAGECVQDRWDLDWDDDTWESLGACAGIDCS